MFDQVDVALDAWLTPLRPWRFSRAGDKGSFSSPSLPYLNQRDERRERSLCGLEPYLNGPSDRERAPSLSLSLVRMMASEMAVLVRWIGGGGEYFAAADRFSLDDVQYVTTLACT